MLQTSHYRVVYAATPKTCSFDRTSAILTKCWILQKNPTLISVSQLSLRNMACRQMLNFLLKFNIAYFANVGFRVNIQHFDPSVLSRQTKPHCGLPQLWGQFCLMLLLYFRSVPNGLKKWSIQSNRFSRWIGSQLNLFWSLPGEKRARFDQGSRNCLPKIVRQRDTVLTSCWFARRPFIITI